MYVYVDFEYLLLTLILFSACVFPNLRKLARFMGHYIRILLQKVERKLISVFFQVAKRTPVVLRVLKRTRLHELHSR